MIFERRNVVFLNVVPMNKLNYYYTRETVRN